MATTYKNLPITARTTLISVDSWRRNLWPAWALENDIEVYANGGPPPGTNENDEVCSEDIVPLGFAKQFMQKQMDPLTDPLFIKPGIIDAKYDFCDEDDTDRKTHIETAVNEELNKVAGDQLTTEITYAAGRLTLTGRCAMYRRSPDDWLVRNGRIIHPPEAGLDPRDDSFREWAFQGKLSLKDIEENLNKNKSDGKGWRRESLQRLKLWIMAAECQRNPQGSYAEQWGAFDPNNWLSQDLWGNYSCSPIDVYWYFRKNGRRSEDDPEYGGHEKIDMFCICRFGSKASVQVQPAKGGYEEKWLQINTGNEAFEDMVKEYRKNGNNHALCEAEANERLLYSFEDRFPSVDDCLFTAIDDARVAGEQRMSEVRGVGRSAMPKLAIQEGLLSAVIEGTAFAAQPNWTVSGAVGETDRKKIERHGIRSFEAMPETVRPMEKQNSVTNLGPAVEIMRIMDTGINADSRTSGQAMLGGAQVEFASQAQAQLSESAQTASRRLAKWLSFLSRVVGVVARTLCMPENKLVKTMPCYWDCKRLAQNLKKKWKVKPSDFVRDNWNYDARQLAGAMQRQQAIGMAGNISQLVGSTYPSVVKELMAEALRAAYGDTKTNAWLNPPQEKIVDQTQVALRNITQSFTTLLPAIPDPKDDPMTHIGNTLQFAQNRLRLMQQTGFQMPVEQAGMGAVLMYGASFISKLPEPLQKQTGLQFAQIAQAGQAIPVSTPPQEGAMTEYQQAQVQLAAQKDQRLANDGAQKAKINEAKLFLGMRTAATGEKAVEDQQKTNAVNRGKALVDMSQSMVEGAKAPL